MKKQDTTNTFNEGLIMDLNPLVTPNNVVINCLNGTLLTYNGNENVLQNDMGNGRVETAFLPEGYVPLGTAELGGIVYIVSYNPLIDKCQIGSFPSPERNITTDELGESLKTLSVSEFYAEDDMIKTPLKKLILLDKELHPGDKFQIYCTGLAAGAHDYISAQEKDNFDANKFPRYLKLNVVAIQDNGQINNLNDTLVWNTKNNYYIIKDEIKTSGGKLDLDEYRDLVQSNYNVFNSKVDGKIAILAQLECIDTFDVSWDAVKDESGQWNFYFYLNWTYENNMSRDKINLCKVRIECDKATQSKDLEIDDYPKSSSVTSNDILQNQNTTFYTPYYVDNIEQGPNYAVNGGIRLPRRNDGTDNQYLLYKPFVLPKTASGIANFEVYPGMPFGYLKYLKHSFSVDLDKLGTGEITLKEYKYWHDPGNITLNWALDAYPERNKQIKYVKFNFFQFDSTVNNWIKNNGGKMDEDRVVNGSWEAAKIGVGSIGTPTYEHTVPRQSSYSGHFTENITALEDNQLYLVEMEINYNNEKTVKYYRLLYTSNLFNNYYFSDSISNDFKNISLQSALEAYHPITHSATNLKITNQTKKTALKNSANEEVTKIPSSIELDGQQSQEYVVDSSFESNLTFDLNSTTDNSTFDISVKNISMQSPVLEFTSNSQKQALDQSQSKLNSEDLDEIEEAAKLSGSFTNSKFSGKFEQQLKTPFKVEYKNNGSLPIPYSLQPLDIDCAWLLIDGSSKWINLYISNTYVGASNVGSVYKAEFGDDKHEFGTLVKYTNVYNEVKNKLKGADIVALRFRVYHTAKAGNEGNYTMWGQGTWNGSDRASASQKIYYNSGQEASGPNFLLYAMLDVNEDVQLFTFALGSESSWYGQTKFTSTDSDNVWPSTQTKPLTLKHSQVTDDLLRKPFEKYYKIVELGNTKSVHTWSRVYYYNNYTWNNKFTVPCTGDMVIKINDVEVASDQASPQNLHYQKQQQFKAVGQISDKESFEQYVDMLLYTDSQATLVQRSDGQLLEIDNVSTRKIYDKHGEQVVYLKQDRGDSSKELKAQADTKYKLSCSDERIRAQISSLKPTDSLMVIGRQEEQNITISEVIKLTT